MQSCLKFPRGGLYPEYKHWHFNDKYTDGIQEYTALFNHNIVHIETVALTNDIKRNTAFIVWPMKLDANENDCHHRLFEIVLNLNQIKLELSYIEDCRKIGDVYYQKKNIMWLVDNKQIQVKKLTDELDLINYRIANQYLIIVKYLISLSTDIRVSDIDKDAISDICGRLEIPTPLSKVLVEYMLICRGLWGLSSSSSSDETEIDNSVHMERIIEIIAIFLKEAKKHFKQGTIWKPYCDMLCIWLDLVLNPQTPIKADRNTNRWIKLNKAIKKCRFKLRSSEERAANMTNKAVGEYSTAYEYYIHTKISDIYTLSRIAIKLYKTFLCDEIIEDCTKYNNGRFILADISAKYNTDNTETYDVLLYMTKYNIISSELNVENTYDSADLYRPVDTSLLNVEDIQEGVQQLYDSWDEQEGYEYEDGDYYGGHGEAQDQDTQFQMEITAETVEDCDNSVIIGLDDPNNVIIPEFENFNYYKHMMNLMCEHFYYCCLLTNMNNKRMFYYS